MPLTHFFSVSLGESLHRFKDEPNHPAYHKCDSDGEHNGEQRLLSPDGSQHHRECGNTGDVEGEEDKEGDHLHPVQVGGQLETAERLVRRISGALYLDSGSEELLIRWDDGRFLLLSYALTPETLKDRAERLRQKAGATGDLGGDLSEVSISAGAACARRGDVTLEPAALRARSALLEAERAGCNRVVLSLVA